MKCNHYNRKLNESDRHYINSSECNNCVLCLIDDHGTFTQEEIAQYFGLSKMRICQLEKRAIEKFNKRFKIMDPH